MGPSDEGTWHSGKAFWFQALDEGWYDLETMAEGSYTMDAQRAQWRRDDPEFDRAWAEREEEDDQRVMEVTRRRALDGDHHALALHCRAVRARARMERTRAPQRDYGPSDPKVAAAMVEARIRAERELGLNQPETRLPAHMRPFGPSEPSWQDRGPFISAHARPAREPQRPASWNRR